MSGDAPAVALPASAGALVEAARAVLATPGLPEVALIGGLAVTVRVSEAGVGHRATVDIDLVAEEAEPSAVELLAAAGDGDGDTDTRRPLLGAVTVDVITTSPVSDESLDGLGDGDRLIVGGHRWALETATPASLQVDGAAPLDIRVATAAGLVATKAHAVGWPSARRRATKAGSDLLDLYRLVDLHDRDGSLTAQLLSAPGQVARVVGDVVRRQVLANPAAAASRMRTATPAPMDSDDVAAVFDGFAAGLG